MYLNKAIVFGNLTRDPELRAIPSGVKVCSFAIATNRVWKDKNGQKQEDTQYHNIVVFGPQAENVAQYLHKGSSALIEGRMQTRSWEAPDGKKQYRTEIVADRVQFGPKSGGGGWSGDAAGGGAPATPAAPAVSQPENLKTIKYPEEEINPDDIPF
ncbi:MAG: single-stranded DNA-binding protein [Patescibacteria group bacterium]|nr:single-stranded DNA-binding protein [Patescibacteria group bacterium]